MKAHNLAPGPNGYPLVEEITDVPEFHDCQRLLRPDGTYGPLVAIFATKDLQNLARRLGVGATVADKPATAAPAADARPAALSSVVLPGARGGRGGTATQPGGTSGGGTIGEAAALIVNFSDEAYVSDNFVIQPKYSCLYMGYSSGWFASIEPVADPEECRKRIRIDTRPRPSSLKVYTDEVPERFQSFASRKFPPVARWDYTYSGARKEQYIGIKCGEAWCEIGSTNFVRNPAYGSGTTPTPEDQKVLRIKGWYDEQYLAVVRTAGGSTVPSTVKATLIPHHKLDDYNDDKPFHEKWPIVAYVAVGDGAQPADYDYYRNKLNLERAPVGNGLGRLNTIRMCYGSKYDCGVSILSALPNCPVSVFEYFTKELWWARITSVSGRTREKCVTREDHTGVKPAAPGTARWRWVLADETTWNRCIEGCCEIDGDMF